MVEQGAWTPEAARRSPRARPRSTPRGLRRIWARISQKVQCGTDHAGMICPRPRCLSGGGMAMTHAPKADHRTNWLLAALEPGDFAALEPHLEMVELTRGQVLYEPGDPIRYAYFPHHAVVSLVNV